MIARKTLTLAKPLSPQTVKSIKTKLTPHMTEKRIAQDKAARQQRIKNAVTWLCEQYPACFNLKELKPLKRNISEDVFKDSANLTADVVIPSKKSLRDGIKYYTHNVNYLKAHMKYDTRINLQGEIVQDDPVTLEQRAYATQHLADINRRHTDLKKAHRKAQSNNQKKPDGQRHKGERHKKDSGTPGHNSQKAQTYNPQNHSSQHARQSSNIGYLGLKHKKPVRDQR